MSNVSDREAQPRRHQLADGRRSRGYVPIEMELGRLHGLSNEAIGLLWRLRDEATVRETDGLIEEHALAALQRFYGWKPARLRATLQELESSGAITTGPRGVTDLNYATWCRTLAEREDMRQEWLNRQRRKRGQETVLPLPLSRGESREVSRRDSREESREVSRASRSKGQE